MIEVDGGDLIPGSSRNIEKKSNLIVRDDVTKDLPSENIILKNNLYEGSVEEGIVLKNSNVKLTDCKVTNILEDEKPKSEIEKMTDEDAIKAVKETSPETIVKTNAIKMNMKMKNDTTTTDVKKEVAVVKNVVEKITDVVEPGKVEKEIKTLKKIIVEQEENLKDLEKVETEKSQLEVTKKEIKEKLDNIDKEVVNIENKGKAFTKGTPREEENTKEKGVLAKKYLTEVEELKKVQLQSLKLDAEKKSTESKITNNNDLVDKSLAVIKSKVENEETKEKIKIERSSLDAELVKNKVVDETCTCDFAHSFTKIGSLVGVDSNFNATDVDINKCVGFISYKEGQDILLGAVKCAPINNSCDEVNLDLSSCDIKPFNMNKLRNDHTLLSNIKDIFSVP